ncbi:MAG: acyl-CoA oxidase [Proteobacteria bacterium]|nr:acyl-CoA oxidase [Pseudomonadota bacterium]
MTWSDADLGLLPALPMLYVAWADGELTDCELDLLRSSCNLEGLDAWLDPQQRPSATRLRLLLSRIRAAARDLDLDQRHDLVDLGLAIARVEGADWDPKAVESLRALQDALGFHGAEAVAEFLPAGTEVPSPESASVVETSTLAQALDEPRPWVRHETRALLEEPDFQHVGEIGTDAYRTKVFQWLRVLASRGLGGLAFPTSERHDTGAFLAAFETLAFFDLSLVVKFGVQFGLFGGAIRFLGTAEQQRRWLPQVASLDVPGCFAMTELGHGSNVRELETRAVYDPGRDQFIVTTPRVSAQKDWIGNAAVHGRLAVVFAQLEVGGQDHGVHALVVPIRGPRGGARRGVRVVDCGLKMGLNGVDNGRLSFHQVRVPRDHLLGRFAWIDDEGQYQSPIASPTRRFFSMLGTLVGGRIAVAGASLSVAKVALAVSLGYAGRRRQFGPGPGEEVRLIEYPSHQARLFPALVETLVLHLAVHALQRDYADAVDRGGELRGLESGAAALKVRSSRHGVATARAGREACGGRGYAAVNRFAALCADAEVFQTFEGDNTVLVQLVAKDVLTRFRGQFSDGRLLGLARHLETLGSLLLREKNPIVRRLRSEAHLVTRDLHRDLLHGRELELTQQVAGSIASDMALGASPFEAFRDNQLGVLALGEAHIDRLVFEQVERELERVDAPDARHVLDRALTTWALGRLVADRAWFLEHGYLSTDKSKALVLEHSSLLTELAPDVEIVVEAFGIPAQALGAPIAG